MTCLVRLCPCCRRRCMEILTSVLFGSPSHLRQVLYLFSIANAYFGSPSHLRLRLRVLLDTTPTPRSMLPLHFSPDIETEYYLSRVFLCTSTSKPFVSLHVLSITKYVSKLEIVTTDHWTSITHAQLNHIYTSLTPLHTISHIT